MEPSKITFFILLTSTLGMGALNDNADNNNDVDLPSCGPEENFSAKTNSCVDKTKAGSRPFCKNMTIQFQGLKSPNDVVKCIAFTTKFMRCQRWAFGADEYEIHNESLSLYIPSERRSYEFNEYDLMTGEDGMDAIICVSDKAAAASQVSDVTIYIYSTGWIISIASLAAALVICSAVPGFATYRTIMPSYVASLLVAYLILVVRGLGPSPSATVCYGYGVALQFSFLAAFFWLNVIAFDIWRSVSAPVLNPGRVRLLAYLAYGWGCPLVLVCAAVAVDKMGNLPVRAVFRPKFERECWFHSTEARFAYFYAPISVILLVNFAFFVFTLFSVRSKVAAKEVEKKSSIWRLSIELAVVMGLCWIMEVVSWAVGGDPRYWYATDMINALQGLFVFLVIARRSNIVSCLKRGFKREMYYISEEKATVSYVE